MKFINLLILSFCLITLSLSTYGEDDPEVYLTDSDETMEIVDNIVTWGVGLSGAASFLLCQKVSGTNPSPTSFYVFNGAAVGYFAMDMIISDEDKDASEEIAAAQYGGSSDEQMNSYLRSRDLAKVNKEKSEEKGKYKTAAAVVMVGAAALAYMEKNKYESMVSSVPAKMAGACINQSTSKTAGVTFAKERCSQLAGSKILCNDNHTKRLDNINKYCTNHAKMVSISTSAECNNVSNSGLASIKSAENSGSFEMDSSFGRDVFNKEENKAAVKKVDMAANGYDSSGIDKSGFLHTNPISKLLTLSDAQYSPGNRMITYGVLGLLVGANALANNSAANKYEKEEEYYQSLIDGMENCDESGNCISTGDSSGDGTDDGSDNSCAINDELDPLDAPPADTTDIMSCGGGFLWKPISESDSNLVVLLPSSYASECTVTINGTTKSMTSRANGDRPHYRFGAPGSCMCDGQRSCYVFVSCPDKEKEIAYSISDVTNRCE